MRVFCIVLFTLCLHLQKCQSDFIFDDSVRGVHEPHEHEESTLTCECGKLNKLVKKPIPMDLAAEIYKNEVVSSANSSRFIDYILTLKKFFKNCSVCEVEYSKCLEDPDSLSGYVCYKNAMLFDIPDKNSYKSIAGIKVLKKRSVELPVEIEIQKGDQPHHRRLTRQTRVCAYPTSLTTAEIRCRVYPSSISCIQQCALGFTLPNGTQQVRFCYKNTNRWQPCNFEECKPYVDCGVTLISGGAQICTTATVDENVCCKIRCDHYEDKPACEERAHICDTNGNWTPNLPFCVIKGSGLELVPRPRQ